MSDSNVQYAEIILPLAAPGMYTFSIPKQLQGDAEIGKRVAVQFGRGNKLYTGLIASISTDNPLYDTKEVLEIMDEEPLISKQTLDFWKWISNYYLCAIGEVMEAALPGILNLAGTSGFRINPDWDYDLGSLSKKEHFVFNRIEQKGITTVSDIASFMSGENPIPVLRKMIEKSVIIDKQEIHEKFRPKKIPYISMHPEVDPGNFDELINSLHRAPAQLKALMTLIEYSGWGDEGKEVIPIRRSILTSTGVSDAALRALMDKKVVLQEQLVESRISGDESGALEGIVELSEEQQECLSSIRENFREKDVVLLHGVTSSGKTEVYAHLIEEQLHKGKQVLYLLPEIALTNQLISRFRKYFGNDVLVYHSRMGQQERVEVWKAANSTENDPGKLFLGARSAVFLPFQSPGLIIVDEEHDRSFKQQDPAPRYEARDAAVVLGQVYKIKTLLGSATPSLESYENTLSGKYGLVQMKKRFGGHQMPELRAVDLTESYRKKKMKGPVSSELYEQIENTVKAGEQVILFQNRRGFSPYVICDQCAHTPMCRNCDVSLTYHKKQNRLICHYCGYGVRFETECRECEKGNLIERGIGTEKIEEVMGGFFPDFKLARFDLDSTRKKNAFHNILEQFGNHQIDILIGTQMVTKGLDFDNVGLVGILNADNMLRFPDFRSYERCFQTLTQVAGRAGRKNKRGKVLIQAFDPYHNVIQKVLSNDYKRFVEAELAERRSFHYPPYFRLVYIHLKHKDRQVVYETARAMGQMLKSDFGPYLLGPEFPYIERVRNLYNMEFVIKMPKNVATRLKENLQVAVDRFQTNANFKRVKIYFDVDPY